MKPSFLIILCLATIMACNSSKSGDSTPILTIEGGQISGVPTETEGVTIFKGIPYAAPPVGELRWKAPQPVIAWEGVRVCDEFGSIAPQKLTEKGSFYDKEFYENSVYVKNEDCLYLNVWTPAAGDVNAKLPVAMWIHGGAYRNGYGHEKEFDGQEWAKNGVILVTINYRLGVLGYMAHPELTAESPNHVSGNYGALDQVAAIKWIKNNIEQFGGDPNQITIFGQSAGAGSVKSLVASPLVKGLIKGAIIQSGGGINANERGTTLEDAEKFGVDLADFYGCKSIAEMRKVPAEALGLHEDRIAEYNAQGRTRGGLSPIVDGYFMTKSFSQAAFDNEIADIPYMIGGTAVDMRGNFTAVTDFGLLRQKQGRKVYAYQFARDLPGDNAGSFHSSELWFIFKTLQRCWRPFTQGDYQLSDYMFSCWTNFAKYGNPNGASDGKWLPLTEQAPNFMVFTMGEGDKPLCEMGTPKMPPSNN